MWNTGMKSRQEIKELAKQAFSAHYWPAVGVTVLVVLFLSACSGFTLGIGALILTGPTMAGMNYFFTQLFQGLGDRVDVGTPFSVGFQNFCRKMGGYLWMMLFTWLWSLLFMIPGIIKAYSYAMTPYILGDCPNVRAKDALKLSMRIMQGHKWELFVFELSFIGWSILSAFTLGLLEIFYVGPYMYTALAGYYLEVREEALRTGAVTVEQLNGAPLA